jgi:sn-2 palmitoyl-lipid 9-desaturase
LNLRCVYPEAGWYWWELDMTWWAIQFLKVLGLAQKVILPPEKALNQEA